MGPVAGHLVLHSIGLVVVACLLLALRCAVRRDPLVTHAALKGALLAVLLLVPVQLVLHGRWPAGADVVRAVAVAARQVVATPTADAAPPSDPFATPEAAPPGDPTNSTPPTTRQSAPRETTHAAATRPAPAPAPSRLSVDLDLAVAAVWLAGALLVLALHLARLRRTRRLLAAAQPVGDAARLAAWRRASSGSRFAGRVRLLESSGVAAPACWGVLRPRIVLPTEGARYRGGAALEWALLHELVHLERNDPRDALGQRLLTALFWFHPAAWWMSRELDRSRELACDRVVVERGGRRRSYALALLDSAAPDDARIDAFGAPAVPDAAAGHLLPWSPSPSQLRRRIEMLTKRHAPMSPRRRLVYGLGAAAALSACWAGQLAIASTFDGGDEVLVARCDPKKKKRNRAPDRWTEPRPAAPKRSSDADVVQDGGAGSSATPVRFDEEARGWVVPRGSLDHEVRDSLVRTLLHDDSAEVRAAAAQTLSGHLEDESVKKAFLRAIGDGCDRTRARLLDDLLSHEQISADMRDLLTRLFGASGRSRPAVAEAFVAAGSGPEARQVLIGALQDGRDSVIQLSAAEALSSHVEDEPVRKALLAALKRSHNEVARMAMIRALEPYVGEPEVRQMFQHLVPRDDNPVAVQAMAEALAARADDEGVRQSMIDILLGGRNDLVKTRFTEALAPHVHEPEVKRAFIQILPKLGSDVIRMQMVTALATLVDNGSARPDAPNGRRNALPLPEPARGTMVPVMKKG